eukprot:TRINITY_DN9678_c0_g1_i2.p1 TRINITY_DN9678_c0_g1~~TRINITY_DN9678_c0_g1_i2.p1  ORF type:complete len:403 (+),score=97.04 TRINITY_DN9678_c0_g1_i2:1-1209(+)
MEERWEIEWIVRKKEGGGEVSYFVKWLNWTSFYNSWESRESLVELTKDEPMVDYHIFVFEEKLMEKGPLRLEGKKNNSNNLNTIPPHKFVVGAANKIPDEQQRIMAIGLKYAPPALKWHLKSGPDVFPLLAPPAPGEWLYKIKETPQPFAKWKRAYLKVKQQVKRRKIYLVPVEDWNTEFPMLHLMQDYISTFYCLDVEVTPPVNIHINSGLVTAQYNNSKFQFHMKDEKKFRTTDIENVLKNLLKGDLKDGSFVAGITRRPVYADDGTALYGESDPDLYVAVVTISSFLRTDPLKHPENPFHFQLAPCLFVLAHEIGHLFFMSHCVYYNCIMGGTNGLKEFRTHNLCPVCLHKMVFVWGEEVDVLQRYQLLLQFYLQFPTIFNKQIDWHQNTIQLFKLNLK